MKKVMVMALAAMLVTGCARQVHYVNGESVNSARKSVKTDQNFFVSGIGQTKEVNAAKVCGGAGKVVAVETIQSPLNVILGVLTWGIYTPREQTVHCR